MTNFTSIFPDLTPVNIHKSQLDLWNRSGHQNLFSDMLGTLNTATINEERGGIGSIEKLCLSYFLAKTTNSDYIYKHIIQHYFIPSTIYTREYFMSMFEQTEHERMMSIFSANTEDGLLKWLGCVKDPYYLYEALPNYTVAAMAKHLCFRESLLLEEVGRIAEVIRGNQYGPTGTHKTHLSITVHNGNIYRKLSPILILLSHMQLTSKVCEYIPRYSADSDLILTGFSLDLSFEEFLETLYDKLTDAINNQSWATSSILNNKDDYPIGYVAYE